MENDDFCLVTSMGRSKYFEPPWGMEPQTFGFKLQCSTTEPQRLYGEQDPLPSSISTTYTTEPRPNTSLNLCQAFNKGLLKSLMHVQPDVHGKLRMREMNLPRLQTTDGINFCNIHYSTKTFESWAATLTNLVKQKDHSVTITMYHF